MTFLRLTALLALLTTLTTLTNPASAQTAAPATSESRDAATAYIGTTNFVVGRVARDCLVVLGRTETPQDFVAVWQQRNAKYMMASQKYMEVRFGEAEKAGGAEMRDTVMGELRAAVRREGESAVKSLLDSPDKHDGCKRAVTIIESGAYDFSPGIPIFGELESLRAWAQR